MSDTPSRPIVVTGLGAVSPFGIGLDSLWVGLRAGRAAIGPFDRFDHSGHRTHVAAQVDTAAELERPHGKRCRLSLADRFAVAAAREAVAHAAIDAGPGG
ncbi:MAG TPA: beta-ketoacyl synthase N-terminal-like domain-containing protein, partial [Candidatus Binatia bacterium]|nr:beta-ketoacyl synthase N-terminal-like domain-containing protein [Candidatus Binatia bacterium]